MELSHRQGLIRLIATRLQRVAVVWWSDQRYGGLSPWLGAALIALLTLQATGQAGPAAPGAPAASQADGLDWGEGTMAPRSTDRRFIVMMIPHHEGAIAMADLALTRARHGEIRALAGRIRSSQSRENALMRQWYRQWYGAEVPSWPASGWGPGMGMGGGMGMGMGMGWRPAGMSGDLDALRNAADFDRAFLMQMINHHRMGVMMASHAQWNTAHPKLRELQAAMVRVQSEEIWQMQRWYLQWYG